MEKSFDAIKLLGTLAIEKGWVSHQEIQSALKHQTEGLFFGEVLLNKKLIDSTQLNELLYLQKEAEARKEDFLFGQIAVHNRFIKAEDVIKGLEEQKSKKSKKTFGNILIEKGLLSDQQCNAILATQKRIQKFEPPKKKKKVSCPKCKTFYQVDETERFRKVRCKTCQFIFELGSPDIKVIAEQTLVVKENTLEKEQAKSLIQYLEENHLAPHASLDGPNDTIAKESERYVLGNEIARGGMGAILLTKDVNLRRNIVTKVLLNKKSKLATLRFIEEAQITGQLEHPNIPPVHDLGVNSQNNIFFTMKQIKGETLLEIIKKIKAKKSNPSEKYSYISLISIIIKVCNALEYAHSKNVIHRDIKPENIMVGEYGEVLLMDWGLAKIIGTKEEFEELEGEKVSSVRSEDESSNTIAGTTAGTPAFMSPEQASGKLDLLDQRSDIYSLGATLFNALSLEKPYKGSSVFELLNNVSEGKMQELKGNIPPELKAITLKAMAFKQRDRYQSIAEMEEDLIKYQMGYSVSAKKDNLFDLLMKFYKRNKLLSVVSAAFLTIFLVGSTIFVISLQSQKNKATAALVKAEIALKKFEDEKAERMADNKNSAPTYFAKAQVEAQLDKYPEAEKLMDIAVNYDSENISYRLYRACLALANNNFKKSLEDLSLIKNHPQQKQINLLQNTINIPNLVTLSEKEKTIIAGICTELKILDVSQKLTSNLFKKMELWNKQLKAIWPNSNFTLAYKNNKVTFRIDNEKDNFDLSPLKGIPIQSLNISGCRHLSNLSPLEGMPIEEIFISGSHLITDISSLKNSKLNTVFFEKIKVTDLSPLADLSLKKLTLKSVPVTTLKPILHHPITEIDFFDIKLNNFNELSSFSLESFIFYYCNIDSLNFLNLKNLRSLSFGSCQLKDITPLKDSNLDILHTSGSFVLNITPIKNKNIKELSINGLDHENLEILLTLKNLETLILIPGSQPPGWEETIIKMKSQIKLIGIGEGAYLKSVDKFLEEFRGVNKTNNKKNK